MIVARFAPRCYTYSYARALIYARSVDAATPRRRRCHRCRAMLDVALRRQPAMPPLMFAAAYTQMAHYASCLMFTPLIDSVTALRALLLSVSDAGVARYVTLMSALRYARQRGYMMMRRDEAMMLLRGAIKRSARHALILFACWRARPLMLPRSKRS